MKEIEKMTNALSEWANGGEKRNVLCIAVEISDDNTAHQVVLMNGKRGALTHALVQALNHDEDIANVMKRAVSIVSLDTVIDDLSEILDSLEGKEGSDE